MNHNSKHAPSLYFALSLSLSLSLSLYFPLSPLFSLSLLFSLTLSLSLPKAGRINVACVFSHIASICNFKSPYHFPTGVIVYVKLEPTVVVFFSAVPLCPGWSPCKANLLSPANSRRKSGRRTLQLQLPTMHKCRLPTGGTRGIVVIRTGPQSVCLPMQNQLGES